jgi:dynein heavy chain
VIVVAQHLSEISTLLLQFQNFFGPEIKAVVEDPNTIEEALKKTFALIKPFIEIDFDPFLIANGSFWGALLDQLRKDVQVLEIEAKNLIEEAFATTR